MGAPGGGSNATRLAVDKHTEVRVACQVSEGCTTVQPVDLKGYLLVHMSTPQAGVMIELQG